MEKLSPKSLEERNLSLIALLENRLIVKDKNTHQFEFWRLISLQDAFAYIEEHHGATVLYHGHDLFVWCLSSFDEETLRRTIESEEPERKVAEPARFKVTFEVHLYYSTEIEATTWEAYEHEKERIYEETDFSEYDMNGSHDEDDEPLNEAARTMLGGV